MPEFYAEYRDADGRKISVAYFARDSDAAATGAAAAFLAGKRRTDSRFAAVAVYERNALTDHGRAVGVINAR